MMVVDCQGSWTGAGRAGGAGTSGSGSGIGSSASVGVAGATTSPPSPPSGFLLTDPAVHCTELLLFGSTNMGHGGFDRFFRTHRCNQLLRRDGAARVAPADGTAGVGSAVGW
eukprot:CAMPEP_0173234334 /NCGR_PEP_ID=MMETSP1142-20121109/10157_1 /TAXON_ID=483371 /ORGANISM="non described non described, Strain CCMP2298" /LENGTH=111 /DNA_ID=CAMNT_0014164341 /DNA_START=47 /DNA_END=379 /DNA_ORIENTATION=-